MNRILLFFILIASSFTSISQTISGTVSDNEGKTLAFATISIKGTNKGTVANGSGQFKISLRPGTYTVVCQYVGYQMQEKKIELTKNMVLDFTLSIQELKMDEVIIRRGEDPAISIMKQAIAKRDYHNKQIDSFSVDVYIKGLMRTREIPDRFMGQKIEKDEMVNEGFDSAGRGILFLSESVTRVDFVHPDKYKLNVISSRQSGGGYGISFPFFVNFYNENVNVVNNFNPRGFVSPLADNAFHYYRFRYEGNFFEGNRMIERIRVTPRRKNEPLFQGYLQIIDGEWRIHSLDLMTTQQYQLELIDTLQIKQIHAPVENDIWRTQNQVLYLAIKMFGFDATGNFLNVYENYNLNPGFGKNHFGRIVMAYDSNALKKDSSYWAGIRPVQLEPDEKRDFIVKDSIRATRDSFSRERIDSLRKLRKPVKPLQFFWSGVKRSFYDSLAFSHYSFAPLIRLLRYNTVEGIAIRSLQELNIIRRKGNFNIDMALNARYGLSNRHLNADLSIRFKHKKEQYRNRYIQFKGGKRLAQFNPDEPIDELTNTVYTLLDGQNYWKVYENWFGEVTWHNRFSNGWDLTLQGLYEDRIPVLNTVGYSFRKTNSFSPNHPWELSDIPFQKHQALIVNATIGFQPGQRYIQYPGYKMPVGSDAPLFQLNYAKGIHGIAGSDVNFDKWRFSVTDKMNFKLKGQFSYKIGAGGFINDRRVEIPDMQHFNGNQTFYNTKYLNSFQLAPYYAYSNTEKIFAFAHLEHHFNGLLTNKIPLFNRLKWNLVAGANSFYVNRDHYYLEAFAGIENILKMFRVDVVTAWQSGPGRSAAIRVGLGGLLGNAFRFE